MKRIVIPVILLFQSPSVQAAEVSACIGIREPLDRLACYDKQFKRDGEVKSLPTANNWRVTEEVSPLTDDKSITLIVDSNEDIDCRLGAEQPVSFIVRCKENTTALYLSTHCHMTASDYSNYGHVEHRTDDDKASTWRMSESTNNSALGLWSGGKSIPEIKKLLGKNKLTLRATPYGENPFIATFDITGLDENIAPLREACSW